MPDFRNKIHFLARNNWCKVSFCSTLYTIFSKFSTFNGVVADTGTALLGKDSQNVAGGLEL